MINNKLFLCLLLTLFSISACSEKYTGFAISNPIKTCKNVQVPYQITEEYQIPLKFEVISVKQDWTSPNLDYYTTLSVQVKNVDSETGTPFSVISYFITLNDPEKSYKDTHYIMPGEVKEFYFTYDSELGEDVKSRYSVIPGEKTMTRVVTKYRTEERCS